MVSRDISVPLTDEQAIALEASSPPLKNGAVIRRVAQLEAAGVASAGAAVAAQTLAAYNKRNTGANRTTAAEEALTVAEILRGSVALNPAAGATALNWPDAADLVEALAPDQYDIYEFWLCNVSTGANAVNADAGVSQGTGITFGASGVFDVPPGGAVALRLRFTDVSEGSEAVTILGGI